MNNATGFRQEHLADDDDDGNDVDDCGDDDDDDFHYTFFDISEQCENIPFCIY